MTVFVDLARLKDGPSAAAARDLVLRVPGMSDLLRGTELDLYEVFDALVIASPDARSAPTFLAARHHLTEEDIRAALERGAHAAGERLVWNEGIGARTMDDGDAGAGDAGAGDAGSEHLGAPVLALAASGLVVVAPLASTFDGPALLERMDASDVALGGGGVALVSAEGSTRAVSVDELAALWTAFPQ